MNDIDYEKFIEQFFSIIDKNDKQVQFNLNPIQKKLLKDFTGRDIVLKARQEGVSSLVLAMFTVDFLLMENSRSVCIAHDKDSTVKLFDRVKLFIRSFEDIYGEPVRMTYNTRTELVNETNGAHFYVGTAGSTSFGRSATLTNVHFSEVAFYPDPEAVFTSASQAGTPKRIIAETTANGMGTFFYKLWSNAKEGKNMYKPHFFSWADFPEYVAPLGTAINLSSEEEKLKTQFHLSNEQLAWRRIKISEFVNPDMFKQEYPLYPEEAFISSGNPVFNPEALQFYLSKKELICPPIKTGMLVGVKPPFLEETANGYLKVWKMPDPTGVYVIGGDACEGTKQGDFACAQVIDRRNLEQVAVWHGRVEPDIFGRELWKLGTWYNQAIIAPENNAIGVATVITLRDLFYQNLYVREKIGTYEDKQMSDIGWRTDAKSKPLAIANTARVIRDKLMMIHDEATLMELFSYQYDDSGRATAPPGGHDDRVSALIIAVEMYFRTPLDSVDRNPIAKPDMPDPQFSPQTTPAVDFYSSQATGQYD